MRAKSDSHKNGEEGQQNSLSESPGLKNIYLKWLEHEHISNTKESRNCYSWPLTAMYEGTIIETSENVKYETIFEYFLSLGNYDWIDRILEELNPKKDSKLSSNQKTYAKRLREFLEGAARCHKFPRPDNIEIKPAAADSKNPKLKVQYPKFEGMLSLLDKLSVSEIIDITFKNSIFFDKETAKTHFVDLEQKCKEKDNVTARGNLKKCPQYTLNNDDIKKDKDGNTEPRKLIKEKFGYTLSGVNKNFYGYTISHLWGNANNPLFFTNLVNLALIPDWINHLLDKYSSNDKDTQGQLSSTQVKALKIVNTIRKVAYTYYSINNLIQRSSLQTKDFPILDKYIMSGDYTINVMMPKGAEGEGFDTIHGAIRHIKISVAK